MTKDFKNLKVAKRTPEQGCTSLIKCIFGDVTSGYFYGPDGLRAPLTVTRIVGTPEYLGEPDPDPAKYSAPDAYVLGSKRLN